MEEAAKLTSGIILTKSDKTEKKELKVLHLFFQLGNFYFHFIYSVTSECGNHHFESNVETFFFSFFFFFELQIRKSHAWASSPILE